MASWPKFWGKCKSRLSAIGRCCYHSRNRWQRRCQKLRVAVAEEKLARAQCESQLKELERENQQLRAEFEKLKRDEEPAKSASPVPEWLLGDPVPGHTYRAGMIALSVNLAREIGLRPGERVTRIVFDWLQVSWQSPCYQSSRGWMQRAGLDRMQRAERVDDGIWLVDHSVQMGSEKLLAMLRVRASCLPPQGTPLRHEDMEVICIQLGKEWKQADVLKAYEETAQRVGHPLGILTDGAVELREPAEKLKNQGKSPLVIRDLKHYLANRLEAQLSRCPNWQKFMELVGTMRSSVQQTEMAHFIAPSLKRKARFMNLEPILKWATVLLWHVQHLTSRSREGIASERIESKFGWLREFESCIQQWEECQRVISAALTFFNNNGVYRGAAKQFSRELKEPPRYDSSRQLLQETLEFVRAIEKKLRPGQRLPISTEILESAFARLKQLEQQHSKGGFTSLILVFPTLLKPTTPEEIIESFGRVKVEDVRRYIKDHLPVTLAARRQRVYREAKGKKSQQCATQTNVAA